ncbi:O-fucosyltransferase 20-like [Wolffia australiana]
MASENESAKIKLSYIAVPSQIIRSIPSPSLQGVIKSPSKRSRTRARFFSTVSRSVFLVFVCVLALVGMLILSEQLDSLVAFSSIPCNTTSQELAVHFSTAQLGGGVSQPAMAPVAEDKGVREFWKQPDDMSYRPCLHFSEGYRQTSQAIKKDRRKYLMVGVSGGLNQQRNQIVDAVVIARILGAALVVPVLQVNQVWGDESEFADIFDVEHFKRVLADDVKVVSSLPTSHLTRRPVNQVPTPPHVTEQWIRSTYQRRLNREAVLVLRGFDSRLAKDLRPDLQKLRCKVAFEALRFAPRLRELGNRLASRMRSRGPYIALHLRLEKDVWIRTGCSAGLGHRHDEIIRKERELRPQFLTDKTKMDYKARKAAGLCPMTAFEVTRLLKALGAPRNANIFWAGGEPFGGAATALKPLVQEFPRLYNKHNLSTPRELKPFRNKASLLAAIDFIIAEKSNVFMPSHGGNMARILKGLRAYTGHRKFITPNKRQMVPYFLDASLSGSEFNRIIRELHNTSLGQPMPRIDKDRRDVTAFPIPECMCNSTASS